MVQIIHAEVFMDFPLEFFKARQLSGKGVQFVGLPHQAGGEMDFVLGIVCNAAKQLDLDMNPLPKIIHTMPLGMADDKTGIQFEKIRIAKFRNGRDRDGLII
jgi:hypothetical protein